MFLRQYELWQSCNNGCLFCFNKECAGKLDTIQQEQALRSVINSLDIDVAAHTKGLSIELIGGDFFQGQLSTPKVRELFFTLIDKIKYLADEGRINQVVIFVTLTIGEQEDLYRTLNILLNNKLPEFEVWVSTSYDTFGRFHTPDRFVTWNKHMLRLASMPDIFINTTSIITQDYVSKVNSLELDLEEFQRKYRTTLFFKHPLIQISSLGNKQDKSQRDRYIEAKRKMVETTPWFLPKRKDAIKAMYKMKQIGVLDRLMRLDMRADVLSAKFSEVGHWVDTVRNKDTGVESEKEIANSCGHLLTYMCYADSDKCILCDKETILSD